MSARTDKMANMIRELAAKFLAGESNRTSLITVTNASISHDLKRATVFVTVMPKDKEKAAMDFLKRQRPAMRDFLKKNMEIRTIPFLDIEIDFGEKNRQRVDELLRGD